MSTPRAKPGTGSKPRKSRAKCSEVVSDAVESPPKAKRQPAIEWAKNLVWTDSLVAYLSENPTFRIKLFSDSTAAAKKAGRDKLTAKDGRPQQWATLAVAIFADDENQKVAFCETPGRFATSVETRMRRLKSDYQGDLKTLGATGAGLKPEMITEGSLLANLIESIREEWPWWDDLHSFWRELPNYNPIRVASSQHGVDHAAAAATLFAARDGSPEWDLEKVDKDEMDLDPEADDSDPDAAGDDDDDGGAGRDDMGLSNCSPLQGRSPSITPSPFAKSLVPQVSEVTPPVKPKTVGGRDLAHMNTANTTKGKTPLKSSTKKTAVDKFNDNRELETVCLTIKRKMQHTEEMARIQNKRLKLELKMLQARNDATALARSTSPATSSTASSMSSHQYCNHNSSPPTSYQAHLFQQHEAGSSRINEHGSMAESPLNHTFTADDAQSNYQAPNPHSPDFFPIPDYGLGAATFLT